jgi:hypothetical protein
MKDKKGLIGISIMSFAIIFLLSLFIADFFLQNVSNEIKELIVFFILISNILIVLIISLIFKIIEKR